MLTIYVVQILVHKQIHYMHSNLVYSYPFILHASRECRKIVCRYGFSTDSQPAVIILSSQLIQFIQLSFAMLRNLSLDMCYRQLDESIYPKIQMDCNFSRKKTTPIKGILFFYNQQAENIPKTRPRSMDILCLHRSQLITLQLQLYQLRIYKQQQPFELTVVCFEGKKHLISLRHL